MRQDPDVGGEGFGIYVPRVNRSVLGADRLDTWRRRQGRVLVALWAVSLLSILLCVALGASHTRWVTAGAGTIAVLTSGVALAFTPVLLLRRWRARRLAATLPHMAKATVQRLGG